MKYQHHSAGPVEEPMFGLGPSQYQFILSKSSPAVIRMQFPLQKFTNSKDQQEAEASQWRRHCSGSPFPDAHPRQDAWELPWFQAAPSLCGFAGDSRGNNSKNQALGLQIFPGRRRGRTPHPILP
ncbi:uncharacterized protein ACIQIH_009464 [Cyanocitta cristata]